MDDCKDVLVYKSPGESLGVVFNRKSSTQNSVYGIQNGSALHRSGQVQLGDRILKINGRDVHNFTAPQLIEMIDMLQEDTEVSMSVLRQVSNGNETPSTPTLKIEDYSMGPSLLDQRKKRSRKQAIATKDESTLPGISETSDTAPNKHVLKKPPIDKRLSLTPELPRHREMRSLHNSRSLDLGALPTWRGKTFISLQNYWTDEQASDRLHNQGHQIKDAGCRNSHCVGSQIWPKAHPRSKPYAPPRPKEEMKEKAEEYIKMYYDSQKLALGTEYEQKVKERIEHVCNEIEEKGHYNLTYEELVYGARMGWRNAPRCVNRIVWRQLEVLDARDCTTAKEMFEAICHHLKFATNGGNLRSTITVFPHRSKANSDFRVWNTQLIRYAGYKNNDGTITGDPDSVEFTEVCRRLGWSPPRNRPGMFDVLPLILQANGNNPELFEIPRELVLEVPITHPDYKWFEDLRLRWYAVPAVSGMMLDVGGLEFTAAPFNGWYMSSEIGGRNFSDEYRYNMLKPIATRMGLNTSTNKLWKDRALVELNLAVLHSYQQANVSIVDHHSATEGFMTFFKNETALRGGCPSDWVWLVPPISGGATKVFHQEMLLYYLTPSYEYQESAWKYYHLPGDVPRFGTPKKFRAVATMVMDATRMMRTVMQKRVKATILYATETGRSRNYANIVKDMFDRSFNCSLYDMDEYNRANLENEQLLLVVTSTFGSGDPPANGEVFGRYLLDVRNGRIGFGGTTGRRNQRVSVVSRPSAEMLAMARDGMSQPLSQVKYAVFGLGSRAYPNFCAFAHTVDNLLATLGAEQVYECGEGDELCGQEESFQSWLKECYLKTCEVYHVTSRLEEKELEGKTETKKDNFRIVPYTEQVPRKDIIRGLSHVHNKKISAAKIISRTKLQAHNSDRSTILVKLEPQNRMPYQPGDHLTVYAQNSSYLVKELLERLNLPCGPDEPFTIESEVISEGESSWTRERRLPAPTTLREAFTYYLDITTPPSPQLLQLFQKMATRRLDKEGLEELGQGRDTYEDWKYERYPNLPEVLNQFHSLKLDVAQLLMKLPLLQCRYYSISSSPKMYPNEIHATVAVVTFRKRGGTGPRHQGVCSTWLNRIEMGTVIPCMVRKANSFHMPEDTRTPIIMVGPGTGIAPFRAFWQERMHMRAESLKKQLLSQSTPPETAPIHVQRAGVNIPNTPANRLSIGSMGGPGGPNRRQFVSTVVAPVKSMLEVEIERQQAPVSDLSDTESSSDEEVDKPKVEKSKAIMKKRRFSNRLRRSASDESQSKNLAKLISARQSQWGNMSLYFGCRRPDVDHIYKEEIARAHITGALTEVNLALSRTPGKERTYVQHLLKKNADSIVQQLMVERGHFYVCGDVSMASDVGRTLQNIFEENAAMSASEARQLIENMKDNGSYHEDIFGVTLKTAEVTNRVRTAAKKAWRILVTAADNYPMTPMSSRPPLTPNTPGFPDTPLDGNMTLRSLPKRPTVTVLIPTSTPGPEPMPSGRIVSQPALRLKGLTKYSTLEEDIEEESEQVNIRITEYSEEVTDPKILEPSSPIKSSLQVPQSTIEEDHDEDQGVVVTRRHNEKDQLKKLTRKIRSKSLVETAV